MTRLVRLLAFALVFAAWLTPAARCDEASFDSAGVKIRYLTQGKGEPVVLIHGFSAAPAEEMWEKGGPFEPKVISTLAERYRVIALDCRGHGKSDKPHDPKKYGAEMAEDVVRLMDHLKVQKAHVVGYSMGASIAGKLLATHPDRLLSVTFGGGGPGVAGTRKDLEPVITATAESLDRGEGIGPLILALTAEGQPKPSPEEAVAMGKAFVLGKDQKALAAVLRGMKGLMVKEEELKAAKVPV